MTAQGMYKEALLEHFREPRNRSEGAIREADAIKRGSNPRCGDEIEVGVFLNHRRLEKLQFRGRGCAICIASASMMTEAAAGLDTDQGLLLCEQVHAWFGEGNNASADGLPDILLPLEALRDHPARQKCVLLSWDALADAIAEATDQ